MNDYHDGMFDIRRRDDDPAITFFFNSTSSPYVDEISCLFCKRTIFAIKGRIDYAVNIPADHEDYGLIIHIKCKRCRQWYRFIPSESTKRRLPPVVQIQPTV